ncbi:Cobalamin adenosyltransferase [Caloramator mitchellensis]|uniref:Cobalamin adenosyltransferase n=1 Tax=Caloramator mitchellensis TaxID=908809 RepID=A0A0R3JW00_CALMK|nr:hypothetical protein [Caloramator mitchellensis]KRQ86493.1 Cobalamin adenosyltransferase [Caloramator mitchellensis]
MRVLTEYDLRIELKNKKIDKYYVDAETIITPSAKQFLSEKGIELLTTNKKDTKIEESIEIPEKNKKVFADAMYEVFYDKKPEFMTHLHGNKLVPKNHPRIILRGKLDTLQAKILEVQVIANKNKLDKLVADLDELLKFARNVLRAEVLDETLDNITLLGLNDEQLREMSQNPKKYFNQEHLLPSYKMGDIVIILNSLRCLARETEISAIKAFKTNDGFSRLDIIKGLNRLSSCIYIMMIKVNSGIYK